MIMMGLWFTGEAPFHTVYLHGLVRDKNGEKMSKTKGNVVDPLIMMEQFGTDALRYTLITGSTPGNAQNISEERIEYSRNFGNKLWQMSRFVLSNLGDSQTFSLPEPGSLDIPSRWIMSRLSTLIASVQRLFDTFQYGEAGRQIKDFLWEEFADWYLEISKNTLYGQDETAKQRVREVLLHVIDTSLRLLHPFIPFITEEIWQYLPGERSPLILASWPTSDARFADAEAEASMALLRDLVVQIRNVRNEYKVDPGRRIQAVADGGSHADLLAQYADVFARLCNVERIEPMNGSGASALSSQAATVVSGDATLYLPLAGMIDVEAECKRLSADLDDVNAQINKTESTLGNENFVKRAKPEIVERERAKLKDLFGKRSAVEEQLRRLECQGQAQTVKP